MDIYVYVDDSLIVGDNAVIYMSISESDSSTFDQNEELAKYLEIHKRLNIHVKSGFDNNRFSSLMKDLLQCYYNIYSNGDGRVFLGCNGIITEITN